jgi:hypothetical protein
MKVVQIEMMLSRAEALALRAVLDEYIKAIQYLESNQPQNLPEHSAQERDAVITALTAVENALQEAPGVIDGMGELLRRGQDRFYSGRDEGGGTLNASGGSKISTLAHLLAPRPVSARGANPSRRDSDEQARRAFLNIFPTTR